MNADYERFLVVGAALFALGAIGFLSRRNLILMVLSAEMMLHGVGLSLVTFSRLHHSLEGQAFTVFVLTVAACEAGLALSLILLLYQAKKSLDITVWTDLREPDLPPPVDSSSPVAQVAVQEFPKLTPAGGAPDVSRFSNQPGRDLASAPKKGGQS